MLSFKRGSRYPDNWWIAWRGRSFFGNHVPFGFFFGFKENRISILFPKFLGRRRIGLIINGRTKLL